MRGCVQFAALTPGAVALRGAPQASADNRVQCSDRVAAVPFGEPLAGHEGRLEARGALLKAATERVGGRSTPLHASRIPRDVHRDAPSLTAVKFLERISGAVSRDPHAHPS